jgi:putative restriction endonuclease
MRASDQKWTREQTIVAFNLYSRIPFGKVASHNQEIIAVADLIGKSVNSLKMKIGNFGSLDPGLKKKGITGLSNVSKLDREIWNEFNQDWEGLTYFSERIIAKSRNHNIITNGNSELTDGDFPEGVDKKSYIKARVNQNFFRQAVLSAYNYKCCVTSIDIPELLIASHIIPWSKSKKERMNPRNGLCLNALHDRAFDQGLMTVTPDFKIKISKKILPNHNSLTDRWLAQFDGERVAIPERFVPTLDSLSYHNKNIFKG